MARPFPASTKPAGPAVIGMVLRELTILTIPIGLTILTGLFFFSFPCACLAGEGGGGHYSQGSAGDFAMGALPDKGFYLRNDVAYFSQTLAHSLSGGTSYGLLKADSLVDMVKLCYFFELPALGATAGVGLGLPIIANTYVGGIMNTFDLRSRNNNGSKATEGNLGGLSDIFLMPLMLGWHFGELYLALTPTVYLPTGYYDKNALANLGDNYASFDFNAAVTWLSKSGFELSANVGYMVNTENPATQYLSGSQLHLDWLLAQHVGDSFALGLAGYAVAQTTPDSGPGATQGAFLSSGLGLGPAATFTTPVFGRDLTLIAKWLHDLSSQNRLHGDAVYVSLAVNF